MKVDAHLRYPVETWLAACSRRERNQSADEGGVVEASAVVSQEGLPDTTIRVDTQRLEESRHRYSVSSWVALRKYRPNCMGITFR